MNTKYNADIVLVNDRIPGLLRVWHDNKPIATVTEIARDLIAAGAAARKMSVYDVAAGHFLSGTVAQLTGDDA